MASPTSSASGNLTASGTARRIWVHVCAWRSPASPARRRRCPSARRQCPAACRFRRGLPIWPKNGRRISPKTIRTTAASRTTTRGCTGSRTTQRCFTSRANCSCSTNGTPSSGRSTRTAGRFPSSCTPSTAGIRLGSGRETRS